MSGIPFWRASIVKKFPEEDAPDPPIDK